MNEPKICPYCDARNSLCYWIKSKDSQSDLKGKRTKLDLKLKLPRCSTCKNVIIYYFDAYRNKIYIRNTKKLKDTLST